MKIYNVKKIVNGILLNQVKNKRINGIKIDSREIKQGDLFIALKGNNYDGHDFILEAIEKGAVGIITSSEVNIKKDVAFIKVDNTYESLLNLTEHIRNEVNIPVIAVTGSAGKTTTKELIYQILSEKYEVLKSTGSYNNHIGVPLTFFNIKKTTEIVVLELGMNHFKEISKLSKISKPTYAIITNIGSSHIGNLGTKKNILKAKLEILDGMDDKKVIINKEDKLLNKTKLKNTEITKIGYKNKHFNVYNIKSTLEKTTFDIFYNNHTYQAEFNVPGKHLLSNVLLAIEIGLIFKIDMKDIIKKIKDYKTCDKRMDIVNINNNNIIINDCYNSSYESLIGAINLIENFKQNKIFVIGDILELGNQSEKIHKQIIKKIKSIKNKQVFLVGKEIKKFKNNYQHFNNNQELIEALDKEQFKDSIILIKGSRRMKLEEIKDYFTLKY